jgi:antitoxin component of RelBE/YafQ-DinJ toxin-antitoxin module
MANLTLSIDDQLLEQARKRTSEMGTTVNQYVRDTLKNLIGESDLEADIAFLERTSGQGKPDPDYKFNREEIYDERFRNYGKS